MKRFGAVAVLLFLALAPVLTLRAQGRGQVLNAEYGAGDHWVDVTQRVRSMFRGGRLDFRVENGALGGDPYAQVPKTLRLVVREGNKIRHLEFAEHQNVNLRGYDSGNDSRGLRIIGAEYGVPNRTMDVTDRLNAQIRDGRLSLPVANQTMGGDPAQGSVKSLWIWYSLNGQPGRAVVAENGYLNLPDTGGDRRDGRDARDNQGNPDNRGGFGDNRDGRGVLQITRALYGAGNRVVDVTDRVNAQVRGGQLSMQVVDQNMGGDPARGKTKALTVWYTFNGRPGQVVVNQNGVLNLPGDVPQNNGDNRDNRGNR